MAVAFDAAGGAQNTTGATLTTSHTCTGAKRYLEVGAGSSGFPDAPTVTGITYNTTETLSQKITELYHEVGVLDSRADVWGLIAPSTGAHDVVTTFSTSSYAKCHCISSFTGVDQTTPVGADFQTNSSTDPVSVGVTDSATGDMVLSFLMVGQPGITADTGTSRNEQENINFDSSGGLSTAPGAAGTVTMQWSFAAGGNGDKSALVAHTINAAPPDTEWSIPRDAAYDIAQPQTTDKVAEVLLDLSAMTLADELQIRVYEKVQSSDTQRLALEVKLIGKQDPPNWVSPTVLLMHGWDVTVKGLNGDITGDSISGSVRSLQ